MDSEACFHLLGAGGNFDRRKRSNPFPAKSSATRKKEKVDFFAAPQEDDSSDEEDQAQVQFTEIPPLKEEEEIQQWRKAYRWRASTFSFF
jgi:hypothetical protein